MIYIIHTPKNSKGSIFEYFFREYNEPLTFLKKYFFSQYIIMKSLSRKHN